VGHTLGEIQPLDWFTGLSGFYSQGHTLGSMQTPVEEVNVDYLYTLDLRRK